MIQRADALRQPCSRCPPSHWRWRPVAAAPAPMTAPRPRRHRPWRSSSRPTLAVADGEQQVVLLLVDPAVLRLAARCRLPPPRGRPRPACSSRSCAAARSWLRSCGGRCRPSAPCRAPGRLSGCCLAARQASSGSRGQQVECALHVAGVVAVEEFGGDAAVIFDGHGAVLSVFAAKNAVSAIGDLRVHSRSSARAALQYSHDHPAHLRRRRGGRPAHPAIAHRTPVLTSRTARRRARRRGCSSSARTSSAWAPSSSAARYNALSRFTPEQRRARRRSPSRPATTRRPSRWRRACWASRRRS